jgi:hypothetical protein
MTTKRMSLLFGFSWLLMAATCNSSKAAPPAASAAKVVPAASAKPADSKVTKIIFVGKEHACDCTRKSVDAGWAALQKALGTPAKLPVERFQVDTEGDKVAPYRAMRPMMALPAIYFLDAKGGLVELLQGDVDETQIATVMKR